MKLRPRLPSPSMVVALIALVVALGGTSYAAITIRGKNVVDGSLTGKDIKNRSITRYDIKNRTLTGTDIRDNSITGAKIRNGSLTGNDFRADSLPRGATGPAGPAGPKGDPGVGRWVLVNANGQIEDQSGGFSIAAAYPAVPASASGNVYIDAGGDLGNSGVVASIAPQTQIDQNADAITDGTAGADANPEFSGEIVATRCQIAGIVSCAPAAAQNTRTIMVSPRNSDGTRTTPTTRKRFYVIVTP